MEKKGEKQKRREKKLRNGEEVEKRRREGRENGEDWRIEKNA